MILETNGPFVLEETQTDGTKWTFTFGVASSATHALTKIEDRSGNYIEMLYGAGRLLEIRNSDDASLTLNRDNNNPALFPVARVTSVEVTGSDPIHKVEFDYDTSGRLTTVKDVLGKDWTFAYDSSNDKLTSATDPLPNTYLSATYDGSNRISTYEAQNGPWTLTYSGMRTNADDAFSNRWIYEHSGDGITAEINEPEGGVHTLTFDTKTDPSGYTDPEGVTVSWDYNDDHLPTSYTPAGVGTNSIDYAYDPDEHWVDSVTGLDGGVTTFTRDAAGRVLTEQKPDGGQWTATYDANTGDRLTLTLPLGNVPGGSGYDWSFTYDNLGQITDATDPTGRVFEFDYTDAGDLEKFRRPDHEDEGQTVMAEWVYSRDAAGKITGITDPLLNTWTREYDDAGRLTSIQGPVATQVDYGYDARHRITTATVVDGVNDPVTTYGYDAAGRLTTKTLPNGSVWTYGYDSSSRLTSVTDPLLRVWTYDRDDAGRVTSVTHPGGQVVTMTRDAAGRLATRTIPGDRIETFSYSAVTGRITQAETDLDSGGWIGTLDWGYDNMGRPDSITTSITEGATSYYRELQLGYDVNGNRTSLSSLPSGEIITYGYDELDRITSADSDTYDNWTFDYHDYSGHRIQVATTGATVRSTDWTYDEAGRIKTTVWSWPAQNDTGSISYEYDFEGRTEKEISGTIETVITYGALGLPSLIEDIGTQGPPALSSTSFTYDLVGSLTSRTRTEDSGESTEWEFAWDAANRLTHARQDDETRVYTWDDNPTDLTAAQRIWRSPTAATENAVEILIGFDGRTQKIDSYDVAGATPETLFEYRWAPLEVTGVLEVTELLEDDTYETSNVVWDIGGYYAAVSSSFADKALVSPELGVDQAGMALAAIAGSEMPNQAAPYGLGGWRGMWSTLSAPGADNLAEVVTSLIEGGLERRISNTSERRPESPLGTLEKPAFSPSSVWDDWLGANLAKKETNEGDDYSLVKLALQTSTNNQGPATPSGANNFPQCQYSNCNGDVPPLTEMWPEGANCQCTWAGEGWPDPPANPIECEFEFGVPEGYESPIRYEPPRSEGGVSLATGELVLESTDLSVFDPGGTITFTRTYRSGINYVGPMGHRWLHNWNEQVRIGTSSNHPEVCGKIARWIRPDGSFIDFQIQDDDEIFNPPDSDFKMRKIPNSNPVIYEIRHVGDTVRAFKNVPPNSSNIHDIQTLTSGSQSLTFTYYEDSEEDFYGLLDQISSNSQPRLKFHYMETSPGINRLQRVENSIIESNDWVSFEYNDCDELKKVLRPSTHLTENGAHDPTSTYQPITEYTYDNLGPFQCDHSGHGQHLITEVKSNQFDPVADEPPGGADLESRLTTSYFTPQESLPNYVGKVKYQCFADEVCASADLQYSYTGYPTTTTVTDNRIGGVATQYELAGGLVTKLVEDYGGLNRETTYTYDTNGMRAGGRFADGRCEETTYTTVNDVQLPETTRIRTAAQCGTGDHSEDLVTRRTYEPFGGRVRSITGPEAFPNGDVTGFDPENPPVEHTTFFFYDYDEGGVDPLHCDEWDITCPTAQGDLNGDPGAEDNNSFGNVVLQQRYNPIGGGSLDTKQTYDSHGRPLRQTNPDLTYTELRYYDHASDPNLWGFDDIPPASGDGPLAQRQVFSNTGVGLPPTQYAWSAQNRVVATKSGTGVISSRSLAENGNLLSEKVCVGECAAAEDILRKTLFTYDLRGRLLWGRVEDSTAAPLFEKSATYDDLDRMVTSTVDPAGLHLTTTYYYDGIGRQTETVSPEERSTCFYYDSLDRMNESRRDVDGDCDDVSDTEAGDITTKTDYDAMDRPVITTDGEGTKTYYWYDAHGRPEFVSDGKPESPAEVFDIVLFLESEPPALPTDSEWWAETRYDDASRPIRSRFYGRDVASTAGTSGFLQASWMRYDENGRVTDTYLGVSQQGPFVDQDDWNAATPTETEDTLLSTTTTVYDSEGRVSQTIDAGGRVTDYLYDVFGRLEYVLDPVYGICDDPAGQPCASGNDCNGTCNLNGRDQTRTFYDSFGRPEKTERTTYDPDDIDETLVSKTVYDAWGRVDHQIGDPSVPPDSGEDLRTDFLYDPLGRTEQRIRRWNADGTSDDQDQVVKRVYDAAGRIKEVHVLEALVDPDPPVWAVTKFDYDGDGQATRMTDAEANATDYEYTDGLGRLDKMFYPLAGGERQTVSYTEYNGRGQPLTIQFDDDDDNADLRLTWTLDYDERGRLKQRVGAADVVELGECADDPSVPCANTQACIDAGKEGPCDVELPEFFGTTQQDFVYDDLGRVVEAIDYSPDEEFEPEDHNITVQRAYNSAGQLLTSTQLIPRNGAPVSHTVASVYNEDGFRRSLIYPAAQNTTPEALESHHIDYLQDSKGRLEWIIGRSTPDAPIEEPGSTWPDRNLARYRYSGSRVWSRWYGNETELRVSTDDLGRVTKLRTTPQTGADVVDFLYGYDRVGNLTHEQRGHEQYADPTLFRTRIYTNDLMGRMTNWSEGPATTGTPPVLDDPDNPDHSETWILDLVGNWDSRVSDGVTDNFTDNSLNQYTQVVDGVGTHDFVHDWLGQLREDEPRGQKYVWDMFGRLTRILFDNPSETLKAQYRYDAFNRRVERYVPPPGGGPIPDATTWFIYDGWRAIEERGLLNSPAVEIVRARYGFGIGLDEVLWMDRDLDLSGTVESRYFIHHDLRGSAVAATNDPNDPEIVADVVERYTYSEYGVASVWTDPTWSGNGYPGIGQSYSDIGLPYLYTGQRYDSESGLYYFKNRFYDAYIGRFTRRDLLGYVDGPGLYQYARSSPSSGTDSLGLSAEMRDPTSFLYQERMRQLRSPGNIPFMSFSGRSQTRIKSTSDKATLANISQYFDSDTQGLISDFLSSGFQVNATFDGPLDGPGSESNPFNQPPVVVGGGTTLASRSDPSFYYRFTYADPRKLMSSLDMFPWESLSAHWRRYTGGKRQRPPRFHAVRTIAKVDRKTGKTVGWLAGLHFEGDIWVASEAEDSSGATYGFSDSQIISVIAHELDHYLSFLFVDYRGLHDFNPMEKWLFRQWFEKTHGKYQVFKNQVNENHQNYKGFIGEFYAGTGGF